MALPLPFAARRTLCPLASGDAGRCSAPLGPRDQDVVLSILRWRGFTPSVRLQPEPVGRLCALALLAPHNRGPEYLPRQTVGRPARWAIGKGRRFGQGEPRWCLGGVARTCRESGDVVDGVVESPVEDVLQGEPGGRWSAPLPTSTWRMAGAGALTSERAKGQFFLQFRVRQVRGAGGRRRRGRELSPRRDRPAFSWPCPRARPTC